MDLYAPITKALENTQGTITDLIKMYMANELNKQQMDMKRAEMAQQREETQFQRELSLEQLAEQRRQRMATEQYQGKQLGISQQGVDLQKQQQTNQQKQWEEENRLKGEQNEFLRSKADEESKRAERESQAKYGTKTAGEWGKSYGVHPDTWKSINVDPSAEMTSDQFDALYKNWKPALALANSNSVKKQMDQIATLGKNEKDPGMREQYAKKYDALAEQAQMLDRFITGEGIPDKLLIEILKNEDLPDKEEAAQTAKRIIETWKNNPLKTGGTARPSDLWNKKTTGATGAEAEKAGQMGITREMQELRDYFKDKPAVLEEAGKIAQAQGTPAMIDFLRKKKRTPVPQATESEPTFRIRPGSPLSKAAKLFNQSQGPINYDELETPLY